MKKMKKLICALLASLMLVCVPVDGYVQGATAVTAATAWEIMQTLLLSLGITVMVADSALGETVCDAVVGAYNTWVDNNDKLKDLDGVKLATDVTTLLMPGTALRRTVKIGEKCWSGLKEWSQELAVSKTSQRFSDETWVEITRGYKEVGMEKVGDKSLFVSSLTQKWDLPDGDVFRKFMTFYAFGLETFALYKSVLSDSYYAVALEDRYVEYNKDWGYEQITSSAGYAGYYTYSGEKYKIGEWSTLNFGLGYNKLFGIYVDDSFYIYDAVSDVPFPKDDALSYDVAPGAGTAVKNGTWDVVTKGRTWDGETLSGDVAISIPQDIATDVSNVIAGTDTVSGVLEKVDALPVDTSKDRVIDYPAVDIPGALDYVGSKDADIDVDVQAPPIADIKPGTSDYYVEGLETVFPFCLPFDVIDFLSVLSAPAKAPCFTVPIKYPTRNGMATYNMEVDLSQFDSVARILRTAETLLFCVGLASVTRSLYIRG